MESNSTDRLDRRWFRSKTDPSTRSCRWSPCRRCCSLQRWSASIPPVAVPADDEPLVDDLHATLSPERRTAQRSLDFRVNLGVASHECTNRFADSGQSGLGELIGDRFGRSSERDRSQKGCRKRGSDDLRGDVEHIDRSAHDILRSLRGCDGHLRRLRSRSCRNEPQRFEVGPYRHRELVRQIAVFQKERPDKAMRTPRAVGVAVSLKSPERSASELGQLPIGEPEDELGVLNDRVGRPRHVDLPLFSGAWPSSTVAFPLRCSQVDG